MDLISRKAVINEMKDMYTAAEKWAQDAKDDETRARAESCMATNVELKLRIEKLPSAQPQRMRGKWNELKLQAAGYWQCSACGFPSEAFAAAQLYKFCPNCGADMRG